MFIKRSLIGDVLAVCSIFCRIILILLLVSCVNVVPPTAKNPKRTDPLILDDMKQYSSILRRKVSSALVLPEKLLADKNLDVVVVVTIQKDGKILDIKVGKPSADPQFDAFALNAVRSSEPLPPLPVSFNTEFIELGIMVRSN